MKRDGVFERKDRAGWWVSYVDASGARKREKVVAHTRKQALDVLSAIKARVQREEILGVKQESDISTADFMAKFLKHQSSRIHALTLERQTHICEVLKAHLPEKLRSITKLHVADFVSARSGTKAAGTVVKEVSVLKHALKLAVEWDILRANPTASVVMPKLPKGRTRYLTPDELKKALGSAPEWLRGPIALAAVTGMRLGELMGLKWTDIDLVSRLAYVRETQNEDMRVVSLNNLAVQVLRDLLRSGPSVFSGFSPEHLSVATRRLFVKEGIAGASFHSLRHTAASWLVMGGVDLYTVSQILGHKSTVMTARYSHLSPGHMATAVGSLDSSLAGVLESGDPLGTNETVTMRHEVSHGDTIKAHKHRVIRGDHRRLPSRARV